MGTMMPSAGLEMRTRRASWTVLLAPSPRKMDSGSAVDAVALGDEGGHRVADHLDALGLGVGAEAVDGALEHLARALHDVGGEELGPTGASRSAGYSQRARTWRM
jgi:hypothetical protein